MTIEEFGDIIGCNLIIKRYANKNNRYIVFFENVEIKTSIHDVGLKREYGEGKSVEQALVNYVEKIRNMFVVVDVFGDRKIFGVPYNLEVGIQK